MACATLVAAVAGPASATVPTGNALVNPGGEAGPGGTDSSVIYPPPGWATTGAFTATQYGATGFPAPDQSAAIGGGANFFAGGNAALSSATQTVDLSAAAADADAGRLAATLSGYLGGYAGQDDNMVVTATFLNGSGDALGGPIQIGPVTQADRGGQTVLLARTATATAPAGTRAIRVTMTATRVQGVSNDGYADNVALSFSGKRPTATRIACNRGPDLFSSSVCTATVADLGLAPPVAPTGTVTFTTPRGSFATGSACTLAPSTSSPSTPSCSVTYVPGESGSPAGIPIPVSASYGGDAVHDGSGADTTPAVHQAPGVVPDPPAAADCASAAGAAGASAARARAPWAHLALNQLQYPKPDSSFGDKASYNAQICMLTVQGGMGRAVQFTSIVLPGYMTKLAITDPEPETKVGLIVGTVLVSGVVALVGTTAGDSIVRSADDGIRDPPDPHYRAIARARSHPRLLVRSGHGIGAGAARAFAALLNTGLDVSAVSRALVVTIDRTAGARRAGNRAWEGRQARAAIAYAKRLASLLDLLRARTGVAARFAGAIPDFTRRLDAAALARAERSIARHGLPARAVARLRRLGFDAGEIHTIRTLSITAKLETRTDSLAKVLADPRLAANERMAAAAWRIWIHAPEVSGPAKLR